VKIEVRLMLGVRVDIKVVCSLFEVSQSHIAKLLGCWMYKCVLTLLSFELPFGIRFKLI